MNQTKNEKLVMCNIELLRLVEKYVSCFRDQEMNEAYNRVEYQLQTLEKTGESCDFTYFKQLCHQLDDRLIALMKEKANIAKNITPEMLQKFGLVQTEEEEASTQAKKPSKIGF